MISITAYMLDDWIRFWDLNFIGDMNCLVVGNVNGFVMGNWDWDLLDDCQSLFFMMMMMTTVAAVTAR